MPKANGKLVALESRWSEAEETQRKAEDGARLLARMLGLYDEELEQSGVPAPVREKLLLAFQSEILIGE